MNDQGLQSTVSKIRGPTKQEDPGSKDEEIDSQEMIEIHEPSHRPWEGLVDTKKGEVFWLHRNKLQWLMYRSYRCGERLEE